MRSWIEVSLGAIRANFRAIRTLVGEHAEVMPVVKADAYRHGAVEVSRALEAEATPWLAVSNVEEGIALRQAGIGTRILVMAGFLPRERRTLLEFDLTPVLHSLAEIPLAEGRYHLKVDSGMGRLGTLASTEDIVRAVAAGPGTMEGLMTHFASSENCSSTQTEEQIARFEAVLSALRAAGLAPRYVHSSATNSLAYRSSQAWGNLVRPGLAVYGYISPASGGPHPALQVKPALMWKACVLAVKDVGAGALIGYGGTYVAERPMRIAVLAAGYADGIPHQLSNRGSIVAQGKLVPIIGAVSMDLTTIDASSCSDLQVGDAVTILGSEGEAAIDAHQIAKLAGVISYSVLCGISARVKRVYVE